jgi:hypothetical protein
VKKVDCYKQALEIMQNGIDAKKVCLKLAQERPDLFIKFTAQGELIQKIIEFGRANTGNNYTKIQAIKYYREVTNVGLKEAKDAVEDIWRQNGIQDTNFRTF